VDFLKRAGGFSISKSLCRQPATDTKPEILCPFYEECEYQRNQRKAARARFVPDDPCPPKHTLPCATQD